MYRDKSKGTTYLGMNPVLAVGTAALATWVGWLLALVWLYALFIHWDPDVSNALWATGVIWLVFSVVTCIVGGTRQGWFDGW